MSDIAFPSSSTTTPPIIGGIVLSNGIVVPPLALQSAPASSILSISPIGTGVGTSTGVVTPGISSQLSSPLNAPLPTPSSSSSSSTSSPYLHVSSLSCQDLPSKTPDAEIALSLSTVDKGGKSRRWFKTSRKPANAAKWGDSFDVPIDSSIKSFKITCWDKTKGKVFVGELTIPANKFHEFSDSIIEQTFQLGPRTTGKEKKSESSNDVNVGSPSSFSAQPHPSSSSSSSSSYGSLTVLIQSISPTIPSSGMESSSSSSFGPIDSSGGTTERSRRHLSKSFRLSANEIKALKEFSCVFVDEGKSIPGTLFVGSSSVLFVPTSEKRSVVKQYEKQVFLKDILSINKKNTNAVKSAHIEILTWDQKYSYDVFDTENAVAVLNHSLAAANIVAAAKLKVNKEKGKEKKEAEGDLPPIVSASHSLPNSICPISGTSTSGDLSSQMPPDTTFVLAAASSTSNLGGSGGGGGSAIRRKAVERSATIDSLVTAQMGGAIIMRSPSPKPPRNHGERSLNMNSSSETSLVPPLTSPLKPPASPRAVRSTELPFKKNLSGEQSAELIAKPPGPLRTPSLPTDKFQLKHAATYSELDRERVTKLGTQSASVVEGQSVLGEAGEEGKSKKKEEAERKRREKEEQQARIKEQKELLKKKGKKERLDYAGEVHLQIRIKEDHLFVKVVECRNLDSKDSNGFSDPYVYVHYGNSKKKTKTVKKNLNPVFNEEFEFLVSESPVKEVKIVIWDWDRMSADDHIGSVVVPISGNSDDWFTIVDEEKQKVWQPAVSSAPATLSSPDFALGGDPSSSNILSGSGGQSSTAQLFSQSSPVGAGGVGVTSGIGGGQVPTPQALSEAKKVLDLPTSKSTYTERLAARKVKARARIAIARAEHTLPDEKLKRLEQKKELKAKGRDPDGKITKTVLVMFVLFLLLEWFRRDM